LIGVVIAAVVLAVYYPRTPSFSPDCSEVIGRDTRIAQAGYSYSCGSTTASDGMLSITYHDYHFAVAKDLDLNFHSTNDTGPQAIDSNEVFLLVNITLTNVGSGNTSVGGGWSAWVTNGKSWVSTTDTFVNASFPDTYPNQTLPGGNGGLYLPPGATADLWLFFSVETPSINQTAGFQLQYLTFIDQDYGGTYLGGGAYNCQQVACTDPKTELIIST
jgi:hypothetical protein